MLVALLSVGAGAGLTYGARAESGEPKAHVPSPEAGHALAEKLCVSCHLVDGESKTLSDAGPGTAQVGPPPFKSIADKPGQSFEHIKAVLIKPHAPMPDMQLTNDEIIDIAAYLDSLKRPGTPALVPLPGDKTDRPKNG